MTHVYLVVNFATPGSVFLEAFDTADGALDRQMEVRKEFTNPANAANVTCQKIPITKKVYSAEEL